jgi:hypothetical protein
MVWYGMGCYTKPYGGLYMGACIIYSFWREHIVGKYWMSHSVSVAVRNGGGGMNE